MEKYRLKTAFVIPEGTLVTKEIKQWIIDNCKEKTDFVEDWGKLFRGGN